MVAILLDGTIVYLEFDESFGADYRALFVLLAKKQIALAFGSNWQGLLNLGDKLFNSPKFFITLA